MSRSFGRKCLETVGLLALGSVALPSIASAQITGGPPPHPDGIPIWFAFPVLIIIVAVAQVRSEADDRPRERASRTRRVTEASVVAFFIIGVIVAVRWFPELTGGLEGVQGLIQDFNRSGGSWIVLVAATIAMLVYFSRGRFM